MWPRKRGEHPPRLLGAASAGLGELPGDAADLDHRHAGAVGQDHGHLQDDLQLVPDAVRGEVVERLGAVARLEQERLAPGHLAGRRAQASGLAGEDERRHAGKGFQGLLERVGVRPLGLLHRGTVTPRAWSPGPGHDNSVAETAGYGKAVPAPASRGLQDPCCAGGPLTSPGDGRQNRGPRRYVRPHPRRPPRGGGQCPRRTSSRQGRTDGRQRAVAEGGHQSGELTAGQVGPRGGVRRGGSRPRGGTSGDRQRGGTCTPPTPSWR